MPFWKKNLANVITGIRIAAAIAILFLRVLSLEFFLVYGICGVTDILDGFIARKYHLESRFGSILDSAADWLFLSAMAFKMFPVMIDLLALWNWFVIGVPFVFHMIAYIICAIKFHKFSSLHTYSNKLLSATLFLYPFTFIGKIRLLYELYAIICGVNALYGSLEMNAIHIIADEYDSHNQSIFHLMRNKKKKAAMADNE